MEVVDFVNASGRSVNNGSMTLLHNKAHGFVNASIVWADDLDAPAVEFRQFHSRDAAVEFAAQNNLVVSEEAREILDLNDE